MGRRATRVVRRSKQNKENESTINHEEDSENTNQVDKEGEEEESNNGFFACYLLCSLSPRAKGHTYIGFTVNPKRRIRQHNGEIRSGAWRTKRGRPWEMILCIYGFPSNVSALQFEWAWQHPLESLAVRKAAATFKSLSGIANKIKLAFTMLNLPSWEKLNLTVNFFSTKYMNHIGSCPKLPKNMNLNVGEMDDLPCYTDSPIEDINGTHSDEENYNEGSSTSSHSQKSDSTSSSITRASSPLPGHEVEDDTILTSMDAMSISPVVGRKTTKFCNDDQFVFDLSCPSTETKIKDDRKNTCEEDEDDVIILSTPTSCFLKRNKSNKIYTDVVDLTDSPLIIQLNGAQMGPLEEIGQALQSRTICSGYKANKYSKLRCSVGSCPTVRHSML